MKNLTVIFLLCLSTIIFSQDLYIDNSPYDISNELLTTNKAFSRERWFYEQRMYPNNFIPEDAYQNSVDQKNELRDLRGFYNEKSGAGINFGSWISIGPTPGNYFNYSNISSRMTTITYDPLNPDIIYIGAAFGGLWKSTDGGNNWTPKTDDEVSLSSGSIAIDPNNTNIIYYGTGEATYSGASYYGRGLLKSTDGGDTWTNYQTGFPNLTYTSRIVIKPGDSNLLFAALGYSGLYKSTNAGSSWIQIFSGRCDDVIFSPSGNEVYVVGNGPGYQVSTDGGNTFTPNATLSMGTRNHIAICNSDPSVLYFAKYSSGVDVFKSTDGGVSFSAVAAGTDFSGYQSWYNFYMQVNPHDPDYAYVGAIDIWRTTNGGTSFTNITNGYNGGSVHVDQHNMAFHPTDPDQLFCVNDGGLWHSTNRGTTWNNRNSSFTLTQFYRIAGDPSSPEHILGGTQDNGTQRTTGTVNWSAAFGGDGGEVCFHAQNPDYILGETQNNGVYRSSNGGLNWTYATSGLNGNAAWVAPILSHPTDEGIFLTARQKVFITTNWGASWSALSSDLGGTIREMATGSKGYSLLYCTIGSTIRRSTDAGASFSNVSSGLPNRTITSVYVHPFHDNIATVTFSGFSTGKIFITTDYGDSWSDMTGNLPDSPANDALIIAPDMSETYYLIAMDVGVFITENGGVDWTELANGLPNTVAMHLDYNEAANKLIIATHGRGVFKTEDFIVPVELNSFSAAVQNSEIILKWSTATETNNKMFEIERKIGNDLLNPNWQVVGSVPGNGTTTEIKSYRFIDKLINVNNSIIKYRLKQHDFDGSISYSKEINIEFVPDQFTLFQNYPNPFNPDTKIGYSVPIKSFIKLSVFNSLGELVQVLTNEEKAPGFYEATWNGANLPSGIYIYQFEFSNHETVRSINKKMLLMK